MRASMSATGAHPASLSPLPVPREGSHHRRPNRSGWCSGLDADILVSSCRSRIHGTGAVGPLAIGRKPPRRAPPPCGPQAALTSVGGTWRCRRLRALHRFERWPGQRCRCRGAARRLSWLSPDHRPAGTREDRAPGAGHRQRPSASLRSWRASSPWPLFSRGRPVTRHKSARTEPSDPARAAETQPVAGCRGACDALSAGIRAEGGCGYDSLQAMRPAWKPPRRLTASTAYRTGGGRWWALIGVFLSPGPRRMAASLPAPQWWRLACPALRASCPGGLVPARALAGRRSRIFSRI